MVKQMQNQIISVSALSNYIKSIVENDLLLNNVSVSGEIASFSKSGENFYFTIKDNFSLLNCVYFGYAEDWKYKIGDKIIATGCPNYYAKAGKLNFNVTKLQLFGEGELYKRFIELKNKLEKEGLFDPLHKLPMPKQINRIGVVTSETGAVIHDIINVATRRNSAQDIILYPIKVQGIGADIEIAKGITFFSAYDNVDAIIVGRGGGSEEDLSCFNSEIVARAVYDCKKFVVSAVGHQTNNTLCDLVADLRAPTPSAAAELLTKDGGQRKRELELMWKNIESHLENSLMRKSTSLDSMYFRLHDKILNSLENKSQQQTYLKEKLNKLNPFTILNKGYAKIEKQGKSVVTAKDLYAKDDIDIYFSDGIASATVSEVKNGL